MTPKKIPLLGRRFMHCADGIAAVEFAIVLPVLITIVFGTIEFGRMMMVEQILATAARAGVRQAALYYDATAPIPVTTAIIKTNVITSLTNAGVLNVTNAQVVFTPTDTTTVAKDNQIELKITVPFSQVSWLHMMYQSTNLTGLCTMRKEG